jgi:uridine kinase
MGGNSLIPPRVILIGIAGSTCSGKSSLARKLVERLGKKKPALISCDAYYQDLSHIPLVERGRQNFDNPDAIEHHLFYEDLKVLAEGRGVVRPDYDFATHTRNTRGVPIAASEMVVVEGLFLLHWQQIRRLLNLKVFVTLPETVSLARRIDRDVMERGRTEQSVRDQYQRTVAPMYEKYILPSRNFADLVIDGTDPIDNSADVITKHLHDFGLMMP